tara:strand:- start:237 stop:485 length:249 start_codon:yes stop_codon:yes gene_type:complete
MNNFKPIFSVLFISIPLLMIGCTNKPKTSGTPALFETKVEAEKAAKNFNCSGAHKFGKNWMPCKNHETFYGTKNNQSHIGHN